MLSPVPLLNVRKLLKQLARRPTLDPTHDLTRGHVRWRTHQDVNVILANHTLHYPDFERLARFPHQVPYARRYLAR